MGLSTLIADLLADLCQRVACGDWPSPCKIVHQLVSSLLACAGGALGADGSDDEDGKFKTWIVGYLGKFDGSTGFGLACM